MPDNTHVPDKLEGYLLQVRHALFELISLDDRIVSVEAYDDVAVETEDIIVAEQTKSTLSDNNPAANRSVVFWKTLKNWCEYLKNDAFPHKKLVLRYVIVAAHALNIGSIPKSFCQAKTENDVEAALNAARLELYGDGTGKDVPSLGTLVKKYVDYCFDAENEASLRKVILLMEIDLHEATYDNNLREKFNSQTIPQEYTDKLFYTMLGWVSDRVHEQTKLSKAAYISSKDYRKELNAQIRGCDLRQILSTISVQPDANETTAEVGRHDTYIKQLEFIDADPTKLFEAASDFLYMRAEKTEWAKRGIITEQSLLQYHDGLKRIWNSQRTIVNYMSISDEKGRGNVLLGICEKEAINYRLQGATTPPYFGPGSLHALANEPPTHPAIGWHPRYIDLLKEAEGDGE